MKISASRQLQLENLLRKLRRMAFDNDHAAKLILKVKIRLAPTWKTSQYHWMYAAE